jgi:hypothetical protein
MIRPTIGNLVMVTLLAVAGILASKWLLARFPVPGLSDVVQSV